MKIRSPDYYNLQALNIISTDHYLADLIASLGTADFVLGSIDRENLINSDWFRAGSLLLSLGQPTLANKLIVERLILTLPKYSPT